MSGTLTALVAVGDGDTARAVELCLEGEATRRRGKSPDDAVGDDPTVPVGEVHVARGTAGQRAGRRLATRNLPVSGSRLAGVAGL